MGDWLRVDLPEEFFTYFAPEANVQLMFSSTEGDSGFFTFSNLSEALFSPVIELKFKDVFADMEDLDQQHLDVEDILVYPNPTSGILYLDQLPQITSLRLVSLMGQEVFELSPVENFIDLKQYAAGIYLLQIETDKGRVNKKVVIKHT